MTPLDEADLLRLWARCEEAPRVLRPACLYDELELGGDGGAGDAVPVGTRDRALIAARARLFGSAVKCQYRCEACGEAIEIAFDLNALDAPAAVAEAQVSWGDTALRLRAATTRDVARALSAPGPDRPAALVRACALTPLPDSLPEELIEAASEALAAADPDAEIELALDCPDCGAAATALFDIGACLWDDLVQAARRLLGEVHLLATAYGWSEAEILAVPGRRRRAYLALACG